MLGLIRHRLFQLSRRLFQRLQLLIQRHLRLLHFLLSRFLLRVQVPDVRVVCLLNLLHPKFIQLLHLLHQRFDFLRHVLHLTLQRRNLLFLLRNLLVLLLQSILRFRQFLLRRIQAFVFALQRFVSNRRDEFVHHGIFIRGLLRELFRLVRRPESVDFLFQDCNLFCVVFSFVQFEYRDIHHHREHGRERVKEVITYTRDGAKARIFLSLSISERSGGGHKASPKSQRIFLLLLRESTKAAKSQIARRSSSPSRARVLLKRTRAF